MRVNPNAIDRCPFINPDREVYYTAADPTEELMVTQQQPSTGEDIFQKKILPWEMMLESDMDFTKHNIKESRPRNHLIVVASLIDRLPNLAGLCRTCEIFNAEQLIIPSLKIKEDPGFSTISVSSDRWMPMDEVVEADVISFLAKKKQEGYFLCGLEQTTTSSSLGDFEFPEKCVLLLGKERQGIPADMLQMLDATVEIPQYGITRSLNVHVSGAICIYEYTKQMQWKSTIQ
jgi:tRNA G18 (ribose-2'-O)-methylase SpoU